MTDSRYGGNVLCIPISVIGSISLNYNQYLSITGEWDFDLVQQFNEQVNLIK